MKKYWKEVTGLLFAIAIFLIGGMPVQAQEEAKILAGVFVEDMSLEGMTLAEAKKMINEYVSELCKKTLTLIVVNNQEIQITPSDIGFYWSNQGILEEAVLIGQSGNIVQRYKSAKDLQHSNRVYNMEFDVDQELVRHILVDQCAVYNCEAIDATLSRDEDSFVVVPGQIGYVVDETASTDLLCEYMNGTWTREDAAIELIIMEDVPRGTPEELAKVKDILGTYTTSFSTSGAPRSANVTNGCSLVNGTTLYPGDEFSTYSTVSPFSEANGYYMAGSYVNGLVVDSLGGGICQVSTTLYNAVLMSELEVTERHNHSMIVTYVDPSADAAIAESSGKDFKFVNNTQAPIYIEGYTTSNKQIVFNIYGMETRDTNRVVRYQSEVISQTYPDTELIYTDPAQPVGVVSVQSAHIGYKANLWKIVTENDVEVSREMVNSSVYKMAPRTATVGVATEDPNIYNTIMEAVATNSIDHVKEVAAVYAAAAVPPATEPPAENPAP